MTVAERWRRLFGGRGLGRAHDLGDMRDTVRRLERVRAELETLRAQTGVPAPVRRRERRA